MKAAMEAVARGKRADEIEDPTLRALMEAVPGELRRSGTERDLLFRFKLAAKELRQ